MVQQILPNTYRDWTAAYERGEARGRDNKLRGLASLYQSAPQQEQASVLSQMAGVDPEFAAKQEDRMVSREDRRREQLAGMARGWKSVPSEQRQAYYERFIAPAVSQMGFGDLGQYDEAAVDGIATQILAAYTPLNSGSDLAPRVVGDALVDPTGKVLYKAEPKQDYQWSDRAGAWIPKPGALPGGVPTTNPITGTDFGIKETNNYVQSILGKVQGLDPSASAEAQAEAILPYLIQQESGGNPNAVSPKGARGLTQVMPGTGRDPGFGVSPLRDDSPQENVRFGRDYLTAMLRRYPGRPDLALAAYNAGPGVADRFSRSQASAPLQAIPVAGIGPKQDEQYTTLSAQEVQALGLPQGTVAQRSPSGQVQIVNKPRDLPSNGQIIDNGDGTTTFIPAGKTTEGERNAAGFYQRMVNARSELDALERAGYKPDNAQDRFGAALDDTPLIGGLLAPIGRSMTSTQGQQYQQAAMNWIRANLRKESGAAIGVKEANDEYRNYFPVLGDTPEVIAQKARNRLVVEQAMRSAAGGALPPPRNDRGGRYKIGQVIEANGKRYRITGLSDPNDPDVEEVR